MLINWENGLILSEQILKLNDRIRQNEASTLALSFLPYQKHFISSLFFDYSYLKESKVQLTEICLIDSTGKIIHFSDKWFTKQPPIDLELYSDQESIDVFINFHEKNTKIPYNNKEIPVNCLHPKLAISEDDSAKYCIRLLKFTKEEHSWSIDTSYIPPLLYANHTLFQPMLEKTLHCIERIKHFINNEIQHLPANQINTYTQLVDIKRSCFCILTIINDIKAHKRSILISSFYDVLYQIYTHTVFLKALEDPEILSFTPEDVYGAFKKLIHNIESLFELKLTSNSYSRLLPNSQDKALYSCNIDEAARYAKNVFLILRKQDIKANILPSDLLLSANSDIQKMAQLSLPGIQLTQYHGQLSDHTFNKVVCDIYKLELSAQWQQCIEEKSISLHFDHPAHQNCHYFLFYELPKQYMDLNSTKSE